MKRCPRDPNRGVGRWIGRARSHPKGEVVSTLLDRNRQALAEDPEDRRAFEALQEHFFLEGDWDEFVAVCRRRLEAPSLVDDTAARVPLLFRLGQVMQDRLDRLDEAAEIYTEIIRIDPTYRPALRQLRSVYELRTQWDMVLQIAEMESRTEMPAHELAVFMADMGKIWLDYLEDPGEAKQCFERALDADPHQQSALEGLAGAVAAEGNAAKAAELYERLVDIRRGLERATVLVALGQLYAGPLQDRDRATECFRRAISDDPRNEPAVEALLVNAAALEQWPLVADLYERRFDLAAGARHRAAIAIEAGHMAMERLQNVETARMWFERATELSHDDTSVHFALAELARQQEDDAALLQALDRVIELSGANAPAGVLAEAAELHLDQGHDEQALDLLKRAHERKPDDDLIADSLADVMSRVGTGTDLAGLLEQRIETSDDIDVQAESLAELSRVYERDLDRKADAADALAQACQLVPPRSAWLKHLERLYRELDRDDALEALLSALCEQGESDDRARALAALGELRLTKHGDPDAAVQYFERALELRAEESVALAGLARIAADSGDDDALLRAYEREARVTDDPTRMRELVFAIVPILERSNRHEQALGWLDGLRMQDADDRELLEHMAGLQRELGHGDELVTTLDRLSAHVVGNDLGANRREVAALHAAAGRDEQAIAAFEAATEASPRDVESLERLADGYRTLNRWDDLARVLRRWSDSLPNDRVAPVLDELSMILEERLDDVEAAIVVLWRLTSAPDCSTEARDRLARLLERTGRFEELAQHLLELRRAAGDDDEQAVAIDLRRGRLLLDQLGQLEEAAQIFRTLRTRHPECDEATVLLEQALRMGNDAGGLVVLLESKARDESDPIARAEIEFERASLLDESLGEREAAQAVYIELADQAEVPELAFKAEARLEQLLERRGDWATLRTRLERHLGESTEDADFMLHERLTALCRDRLDDVDAAAEHLEAMGRLRPEATETWRLLAQLYEDQGRTTDVLRVMESEIEQVESPERELVLRGRAADLIEQLDDDAEGDPRDRVADHWRRVLEIEPGHSRAAEYLVAHAEADGDADRMIELLRDRLERLDVETDAAARRSVRLRLAETLSGHLDDAEAAIDALTPGLEEPGDLVEIAVPLSTLYEQVGRAEEAAALCGQMADGVEANEERLQWRVREAELLEEAGSRHHAMRAYRQVLELAPTDRAARGALADLYRDLEEHESLAELLMVDLDTASVESQVPIRAELASVLARAGLRLEDALEHVKWVLDVEPDHEDALQVAVDLAERLDRHEDLAAILEARLTVERDPQLRASLLERRGDLLAGSLGMLDEAAAAYREALALAPDRSHARASMRGCLEQLGRWSAVLDCLHMEAGVLEGEARCDVLEHAITIAVEHLSTDAALPWLERLRVEKPEDPQIVSRIAELHGQGGRPEARLRALEAEIELSPEPARRRDLWMECARILERDLHAPGRAIAAYESARSCAPRDRSVLHELDRLYDMLGMPHERIQIIETLLLDAPQDDVERLHQAAAELQVSVFGDPHRAVPHQLHLVELAGDDETERLERLRSLGASLRASGAVDAWSRCAIEELSRIEREADERHRVAELRFELADVDRTHLARPDSAMAHLRELMALFDSTPTEAAGALSRDQRDRSERALIDLLRSCGHTVELAERLETRLGRDDLDATERLEGWRELARLRAERLHAPLGAAQAWEALIERDASDLEAIRGLRAAGELLRDWVRVGRGLELELEAGAPDDDSTHRPTALWRRLGEVRWRRLNELDGAAAAFAAALDVDASDLAALRALEHLCEERSAWSDALDHFDREIELLGEDDPARRREVWLRAGTIARDHVGDDARALRAYEAAAAIADLEAADLRDLAELHAALDAKEPFVDTFGDWCRHADASPSGEDALRLSGVLADLGRVPDALEWARMATELDARSATAWDTVADLCRRGADDAAAGEALERAATLLPPVEASKRLLDAALLVEDGDADLALERLRKAVEVEPGHALAHAARARIADRRQLDDEAEEAAGLALDAGTEAEAIDAETMLATALVGGRCALRQDRSEAASRFYGIALSLEPEETEALDAQSRILFDAGDLAPARPLLEARLAQSGDNPLRAEQEGLLARCLEEADEIDAALEHYAAALELAPDDAFAHEGTARIHEARDDAAAAFEALDRWLEHDAQAPSRARTHLRAADHLMTLGRTDEAESHLRKACDADASLGAAWARLVALLHDAERADAALEAATQAVPHLGDQPERASVAAIRGELLEAKGDREGAAEAYAIAAETDPRATVAVLAQARLLRNAGDWFAANQALQTFIEQHPDADDRALAPVHLERGRLLAGPMEDVDEALGAYERALELDPELTAAREPLAGLLARVPERWAEAVEHHAVLLRDDPLRNASLRALLEIARRRDLELSVQFGLALLRAVGLASPSEMSEASELLPVRLSPTPKLDDPLFETARRICSQARDEIAQVLDALGEGPAAAEGASGFDAALREALDEITAPAVCALPTEGLSSVVYTVTALAADPGGNCADSPYLHGLDRGLGRWTRRRIRKTLGEYSVREVQSLDYDAWRSAVRVLAARIAIDRSDGDLRAALIQLATGHDTQPASNADLSDWVEGSSDARALVARMVATWCEKIRRGL